tara:strand:- start:48 stop:362 length:315 start_codon:yes stop_codon:yes gene_type:complete
MKKLLIGLLLIGSAHGATIKIEATTDSNFGAWFMPSNIDSAATIFIERGLSCTNTVKGGSFQLMCQRNGQKLLIYQDKTPQKDAIIATPEIVVKITTMRDNNDK